MNSNSQNNNDKQPTYRGEGKLIRKTGGVGAHGHVILEVEPVVSQEITFIDNTIGGVMPRQFIPSIESGVREAAQAGVLAGYPVIGLRVSLIGGSYHEVDSSPNDFKAAAKEAFKDACRNAPMALLEPVAQVSVSAPAEHAGTIIGDLSKRRGKIGPQTMGLGTDDVLFNILAQVPVSEMFGYATDLRSLTHGRGTFEMTPIGYEEAPKFILEQVLAQ